MYTILMSIGSTTDKIYVAIMCAYLFSLVVISMVILPGIDCRKNVLFIVADDMRPEFSFFGDEFLNTVHPPIHAPNLEKLANKSVVLQRAYVQFALCSPSRSSFLTGRRPDTTHVYNLHTYFRNVGGNFTTIPEYFKQNGYRTIGMGKIFHPGELASGNDDPISWTDPYFHAPNFETWNSNDNSNLAVPEEESWLSPLPDQQIADQAISTLRTVANDTKVGKNFFVAVGFRKPHAPFVFPESMLTFYPESVIRLPDNPHIPQDMPYAAWNSNRGILKFKDIKPLNISGEINTTLPDIVVRTLRRAYWCSLTWIDLQVGRVLKELDALGLTNDTIVTFLGDHGYQLGENAEWGKDTNFELSARAPLMIRIPGMTDNGVVTKQLVEFVDIFPTLVEAAGLEKLALCPENSHNVTLCTEGSSLIPLIKSPKRPWKSAAFSQHTRFYNATALMGYSLRTEQFRYTEWVQFSGPPNYKPIWSENYGTELYDHDKDPQENINVAGIPKYAPLVKELSETLHAGLRKHVPDTNSTKCSRAECQMLIILLLAVVRLCKVI